MTASWAFAELSNRLLIGDYGLGIARARLYFFPQSAMAGYLALILHAHLPFVRHPEHEHFLEEDWFFEAVTESYIPLLRMMRRFVGDSVAFKLTMSLTPKPCAMVPDELFCGRYVPHLRLFI